MLFLSLFLICISCANPKVIKVIGPNDNNLSCEELSVEIEIANQYANNVQGAKKMNNPHNLGAPIFFFLLWV